jgi:hypothetical protein
MIVVTLACGHSRSLDDDTDIVVGIGHMCYCPLHKTNSLIASIGGASGGQPRRPINDALLSTVLFMIREAQQLNNTGKSWEMIEDEARQKLYDKLDEVAGPPRYDTPAPHPPPEVDYQTEYFTLFNNIVLLCQILGIDTIRGVPRVGVVDMHYVTQEATALIARIRDLQHFVKPPTGGHWGADWNSVVHKVEHLVKL